LVTTVCGHSRNDDKIGFMGSINHRITARVVRNRYVKHFVLKRGSMAVMIIGNKYCNYSVNRHVLILKERLYNRELF
jgi:hypothetical protein